MMIHSAELEILPSKVILYFLVWVSIFVHSYVNPSELITYRLWNGIPVNRDTFLKRKEYVSDDVFFQ